MDFPDAGNDLFFFPTAVFSPATRCIFILPFTLSLLSSKCIIWAHDLGIQNILFKRTTLSILYLSKFLESGKNRESFVFRTEKEIGKIMKIYRRDSSFYS